MTRFWWIRHGPTHARGFVGRTDLPADLSDTATLDWLDARLPREAVVVASDLRRASETASAIARGRRRLADDPRLREFDFGQWEGLDWRSVEARDPELARAFWTDPGDLAPPGGESWNAAAARVEAAVQELAHDHAGGDVAVVAHFGVILTQVAIALGQPPRAVLGHRVENLSLTRIDIAPGQTPERRVIFISELP